MDTKGEARRILKSGFGREVLFAAGNYVAPIFWVSRNGADATLTVRNGSIFFLERGDCLNLRPDSFF